MIILDRYSKKFRKKRLANIDTIVIHYICDLNNEKDFLDTTKILKLLERKKDISYHYAITRTGMVYKLVRDENVAWHTGKSSLYGRSIRNSCNDFSIGIVLFGGPWIDFTDEQYDSLIELTRDLQQKYKIRKDHIVGHSFISPGKSDPGHVFNWNRYLENIFSIKDITCSKDIIPENSDLDIKQKKSFTDFEKFSNITSGKDELFFIPFLNNIRYKYKNIKKIWKRLKVL